MASTPFRRSWNRGTWRLASSEWISAAQEKLSELRGSESSPGTSSRTAATRGSDPEEVSDCHWPCRCCALVRTRESGELAVWQEEPADAQLRSDQARNSRPRTGDQL